MMMAPVSFVEMELRGKDDTVREMLLKQMKALV